MTTYKFSAHFDAIYRLAQQKTGSTIFSYISSKGILYVRIIRKNDVYFIAPFVYVPWIENLPNGREFVALVIWTPYAWNTQKTPGHYWSRLESRKDTNDSLWGYSYIRNIQYTFWIVDESKNWQKCSVIENCRKNVYLSHLSNISTFFVKWTV